MQSNHDQNMAFQQQQMNAQMQAMNLQPASAPKPKKSARAYHVDESSASLPSNLPYDAAQFQSTMQQQPQPVHQNQPVQQQQPEIDPRLAGQPHGNIAQPPHDAGARMMGPRSKIDVDQIPSPVFVRYQDQHRSDTQLNGVYHTCSRDLVPGSLTDNVAIDQGNCSPRFIRMTTYTLPHTSDLATAGQLPLALVTQPFAETRPGEMPVQIADFSNEQGQGPPRCSHCKAYINPWFRFLDGGQRYKCNLCGGVSDAPADYFCHLDMQGRRQDHEQRPELLYGSIDFAVPSAYWVQPTQEELNQTPIASTSKQSSSLRPTTPVNPNMPQPSPLLGINLGGSKEKKPDLSRPPEAMRYIFAIDVSWAAGRSGMLRQVAKALKESFYGVEHDEQLEPNKEAATGTLLAGSKVAIITFDRTVHFYNLRADLEQPQMLVVPDLDDMFSPLSQGILVDPHESRHVIESLLNNLESMFGETAIIEAALGGAVKAGLTTLRSFGGQLNIFQTTLPAIGPGSLKNREDPKLYGTEKEKTLFAPQDAFYRQIAEECADAGIGINLFVLPIQYIDVASIGVLAGLTGGEVFFHPRFDPVREGRKLRSEIKGILSRETGYSVTMRIRCSEGLRIADHYGNFFQRNPTDLEFGNIDADKAVAATIKHEIKLAETGEASFQVAVLYTSASGQRRVRCHNLVVGVSSKLGDVFRVADMDTTITIVAKEAMTQTLSKNLNDVRDSLTERCVKVLLAYRKHCAASVSPGQLILPECYKLFPIFALSLIKLKAVKGGQVVSDVRTYYMRLIKSLGVPASVEFFYPRFYPLHILHPEECQQTPEGRFVWPLSLRLSYERMEAHGAYFIQNGEAAILWLGAAVSPALLQDLYGVDDLRELNTNMTELPRLPTLLSQQVRALVQEIESRQRHRVLQIAIARQGLDGTEMEFANMLIEDANNDSLAYADYLSHVHKQIQSTLAGQAKEAEAESNALWRGVW